MLNGSCFVKALVDNGSTSYAIVSERLARRMKLPRIPLNQPRLIEGVVESINREIRETTYIEIDVRGYKMQRVWAYILPG